MPFREAVQQLENAGLVERRGSRAGGSHVEATSLGEATILNGSALERLKAMPGA